MKIYIKDYNPKDILKKIKLIDEYYYSRKKSIEIISDNGIFYIDDKKFHKINIVLDELVELIKATGTKVLTSSNCEAKISGYYLPPNKEGSGDKLVFCTNNINLKDASAAWEVLAHESTHVMQA